MKKIIILLGLVASCVMFTACANKSAPEQVVAPSMNETATPPHQDFKGETGHAK